MIVVAIIGILAAIAIPNFLVYQAKSKQAEAKSNLGAIYSGEITFRAENDTFGATLGTLDWAPAGSTRYSYGIIGANTTQFSARATANIDTDAIIDVWLIDENKALSNVTNDVKN